jgi:integrase
MRIMDREGSPGIEFLKTYRSTATAIAYRNSIRRYLSSVLGREVACRVKRNGMHEVLDSELRGEAVAYFSAGRDYQKDVELYFQLMKDLSPKTVHGGLAVAKVFLMENGVEFPQLFWRRLRARTKGNRALTIDRVPSNVELRKIIQYLPINGKALSLTLASSGMRIGETLKLQVSDLDLSKIPALVKIRGEYTKSGNPRQAYISTEAKEAIEAWLRVRGKYVVAASRRKYGNQTRDLADDVRLFPFGITTSYAAWYNAIEKAGLLEKDESTGFSTLHPHVLRKFFRTRMGAVIPVDVTEALMGHEAYLTQVYRRYSQEDMAAFYLKGEHSLAVFSNGADMAKIRVEFEEGSKLLQRMIENQAIESRAMQKDLEEKLKKQQEAMDALAKRIAFRLGEVPEKGQGRRGQGT